MAGVVCELTTGGGLQTTSSDVENRVNDNPTRLSRSFHRDEGIGSSRQVSTVELHLPAGVKANGKRLNHYAITGVQDAGGGIRQLRNTQHKRFGSGLNFSGRYFQAVHNPRIVGHQEIAPLLDESREIDQTVAVHFECERG